MSLYASGGIVNRFPEVILLESSAPRNYQTACMFGVEPENCHPSGAP
jgi:hypothetical protein